MTCAPGAAAADSPPRASVRRSAPRREGSPYAARRCATAASTSPRSPPGSSCAPCTSAAARGPELVATFYEPGDVDAVARTVLGFGGEAVVAIDAPSGRRLDLLAPGGRCATQLGLPAGRYERSRVCDALLFRRGLPLYPVPAADQALPRVGALDRRRLRAVRRARRRSGCSARRRGGAVEGPVGRRARCASAGCARPTPTPCSARCSAIARRPKRTPWGLQQRIAALRLRGVADDDGGLWHRTLDELDACARRLRRLCAGRRRGLVGRRPARGRDRPAGRTSLPTATSSCRRRARSALA